MTEQIEQTEDIQQPHLPATSNKFLLVLANIVSYLCHPVFMPTVMSIALYLLFPVNFVGISNHQFGFWLISIVLSTLIIPLVSVFILKGLDFISSIHLRNAKERTIPLMISMIFYFWVGYAFNNFDKLHAQAAPFILRVLLIGNFWGVIALFMANIFTKVSLHSAAAGSMVGIVIVLMIISPVSMVVPLFVAIVIAGMIGTARLLLGAHQRGDVWLGYLIGIIVQVAAYLYLR